MNSKSLAFFEGMANSKDCTQNSIKMAKNTDYTQIDAEFILKYANEDTKMLDLAAGTGLVINKLADKIKDITAVEYFEKFSNYITKCDTIKVINQDIQKFTSNEKYDLITMFGIMQYFNEEETKDIYEKYYNYLLPNGKLIVKNQFAIKEDVIIDGYSKELKQNYYSHYRNLEKEIKILKSIGFKNIEKYDIYPPEANRWNNTHFYAIVAER